MLTIETPLKFIVIGLILFSSCPQFAQGSFFLPINPDSIDKLYVRYTEYGAVHNARVKSINTTIPEEIKITFDDQWSFVPLLNSSEPLGYMPPVFFFDPNCVLFPSQSSVLGKSVTIKADSTWIFELDDNQTFTILNQALVDETWVAFSLLNGSNIVGTMQSIEEGHYENELIKTIHLEAEINPDLPSGIFPFHPYIRISTKRGLLEIPQLSYFKITSSGDYVDTFPLMHNQILVNNDSTEIELRKLSFRNIWDLNVGDNIVSLKLNDDNNGLLRHRQNIEVLQTDWEQDESAVHFKWHVKTYKVFDDESQELVLDRIIDTTLIKQDLWRRLDTIPPFFKNSVYQLSIPIVDAIISKSNFEFFHGRQFHRLHTGFNWNTDYQCFFNGDFAPAFAFLTDYVDGLGGPYSYISTISPDSNILHVNYLEYYKKGNEEWGDPGVLTSMQNISIPNRELRIFPTLVTTGSEIRIQDLGEGSKVEISNVQGVSVHFNERNTKGGIAIQLTDFKPGMYLVRVQSADGKYSTGKFIVY